MPEGQRQRLRGVVLLAEIRRGIPCRQEHLLVAPRAPERAAGSTTISVRSAAARSTGTPSSPPIPSASPSATSPTPISRPDLCRLVRHQHPWATFPEGCQLNARQLERSRPAAPGATRRGRCGGHTPIPIGPGSLRAAAALNQMQFPDHPYLPPEAPGLIDARPQYPPTHLDDAMVLVGTTGGSPAYPRNRRRTTSWRLRATCRSLWGHHRPLTRCEPQLPPAVSNGHEGALEDGKGGTRPMAKEISAQNKVTPRSRTRGGLAAAAEIWLP